MGFSRSTIGFLRPLALILGVGVVACPDGQAITEKKPSELSASKPAKQSDYYGPAGVVGESVLPKGKWSFAYKINMVDYQDMKEGGTELPIGDVTNSSGKNKYFYQASPTKMIEGSHIFEGQYAPSRQVTLVATVPIVQKSADFMTTTGGQFSVESEGLGDMSVKGVMPLTGGQSDRWLGTVGFSLPTGKTNMRGRTPFSGGAQVRLPYAMQLGSGSIDLLVGTSYRKQLKDGSWGAKADFTYRASNNGNGYRLGHVGEASIWSSYRVAQKWNTSLRLSGKKWESITGLDPSMGKAFGPMSDPGASGGQRVDLSFGINLQEPNNLTGQRFSLEASLPISQDLAGPQLETKRYFSLGFGKEW